ncbi:hypothetical protein [Streptomyces sp. cg2]|uniref:hypothetical protein n=1 Tax=Streptomyces sp. cg2 TaxID=3238799 RepID=UPI0034E2F046
MTVESDKPHAQEAGGPIAAPAVSVVRPEDGERLVLGATRMRVVEDGGTPDTAWESPSPSSHTFANVTDQPAVMLSMFTPDLYVQYFRDLQDTLAGGRAPSPQAHLRTMSRYATEPARDFR